MHYIDWKSGKISVPPSLQNWIHTLEEFLDLREILVQGGKCNFLRHSFNQDVLENYFAKVRNQRINKNPSAIEFLQNVKSLLIKDFFGSKAIGGTNCEYLMFGIC